MEKKINIAELLKDCPKGMELDCTSYDNVSFDKISDNKKDTYPILCYITDKEGNRSGISFTENGCESQRYGAKCVIFPKGKTTWEGFVPTCKFNDGDIIFTDTGSYTWVSIFKQFSKNICYTYIDLCITDNQLITDTQGLCNIRDINTQRLATNEEKTKLFLAIKDNRYKLNNKTKTLKKLVQPKFDITEFVPFESRVLCRDTITSEWVPAIWGYYASGDREYKYKTIGCIYRYCIPYEGNEHLLGKKDDCDDFYKTWK